MTIPDKVDDDRQPQQTTSVDRLTSRSIRSFVVRNGRTTPAQTDALNRLLPEFGLPYQAEALDLAAAFEREAPVWLEIGFGNGDVLVNMGKNHPEVNILGAEVHESGIGHALIGSMTPWRFWRTCWHLPAWIKFCYFFLIRGIKKDTTRDESSRKIF